MFDTYRAAFRAPGTRAFCAAAFIMRMPIAIYPIGLVLLVSIRTGHYGFAGLLSGVYVFTNGLGNPVLGRLVDQLGQRRVIMPAAVVHGLSVAAICLLAGVKAPDWSLILPAALAGFSYLPVGSLVRARWSYVLAGRPELEAAYSLESTLDELIFTVGPLLVTVIATQLDPVLGLLVGAVLVSVGSARLRRLSASEPPALAAGGPPHRSAVRYRGMTLMVFASVGLGAIFASAELSVVAFCGQHGVPGASGVVLACFALGSGVSGLAYGSRRRTAAVVDRFRRQAVLFAVLPIVFLVAVNVGTLAGCAFVVGLGIAPTLITGFGLIAELVPSTALTEGTAWLTTGLSIGYGAAATAVGAIADAHGARAGFMVTIGAGTLVGLLALGLHRRVAAGHRPAPEPVAARAR
jgi:MFS family permease